MADIVLGLATSHTPMLTLPADFIAIITPLLWN